MNKFIGKLVKDEVKKFFDVGIWTTDTKNGNYTFFLSSEKTLSIKFNFNEVTAHTIYNESAEVKKTISLFKKDLLKLHISVYGL